MGEKMNVYRLLVGKRPAGRPRCRWIDNINMELVEMGLSGVDWIGLAQGRDKWRALVNAVMTFPVLYNFGKLSSGYTTGGLSSKAELLSRRSFLYPDKSRW
jgi:hypothetical protein